MTPLAFDTETFRIGQECQAPRIVCLSLATSPTDTHLIANHTWDELHDTVVSILTNKSLLLVGQNASFDLAVFASNFPDTLPLIFTALSEGRVSDTMIREKLLVLATSGDLSNRTNPDGSKSRISFSLASLVMQYLGKDISKDKKDDDAYRLFYSEFDNMPLEKWPAEARQYAIDDSVLTLQVRDRQEIAAAKLKADRNIDAFTTEAFRIYVDFCLKLMAAWGAKTDPAQVAVLEAYVACELTPDRLDLLVAHGILRPAEAPRPHKNKSGKMTAGKAESVNQSALREYVERFAANTPDVVLKYTDKSDKFPDGQLSVNAEWLDEYAGMDKVLTQYDHRQSLQKLVSTEIPRMKIGGVVASVVHPQYDCLKETGRTSSFSSKSEEYASFNIQNVHPKARLCFVPRPGYLLFSIDFHQMELGTLAQVCYTLFGHSVLRDRINAGVDVHAYTGSQLAAALDPWGQAIGSEDPETIAQTFLAMKKTPEESDTFKFYKHWRKFAKPVNLGYPGGMGPRKFVAYARKDPYNVEIDLETSEKLREIWKATYPEMVEYFEHINRQCPDPWNKTFDEKKGKEIGLYAYDSPFGMHRAGCMYTACANGLGLQTPSAEGALSAMIKITTAAYDWTCGSILGPDASGPTVRPYGFIHDEFFGEVRDDAMTSARCLEMKRLMIEAMAIVTPDVKPNASPCLMRRWNKAAEPVYDKQGNLLVWEQPTG